MQLVSQISFHSSVHLAIVEVDLTLPKKMFYLAAWRQAICIPYDKR